MGNLYIFITGRVKDTFKTTKGKFVVPSPIEWHFAQDNNIEQICLLGLGCPQPVALVVLSEIGLVESQEEVKGSLVNTLKYVNLKVKAHEKVSTIVVVKDPWSVENELLTPTLKIKRNMIGQHYHDLLLAWHEDKEAVIFE